MEALCHNLSVLLQNLLTCKVLELVAEFVQDVFGNIWLVHTAHVKVEALTKIKRCVSSHLISYTSINGHSRLVSG